jgi:hypothetical protein
MNAGDALIVIEQKIPKRGRGKWIHENCSLAESTARLYVQLARNRAVIEAAIQRGVDLSVRSARSLISKKSKDPSERSLPSLPEEPETLFAHWLRCTDAERTEFLDRVTIHGIRRAASEKLQRALNKAAADKPFNTTINLKSDEFHRGGNTSGNRFRH